MKRLIWNIYTAIQIAMKCGISPVDGWRCARESTDQFKQGMWPAEVAEYEMDVRKAEGEI